MVSFKKLRRKKAEEVFFDEETSAFQTQAPEISLASPVIGSSCKPSFSGLWWDNCREPDTNYCATHADRYTVTNARAYSHGEDC